MYTKEDLYKMFMWGFMVSREGYNGECAYDHCSDGLKSEYEETPEEFIELTKGEDWGGLRDIFDQAYAKVQIKIGNMPIEANDKTCLVLPRHTHIGWVAHPKLGMGYCPREEVIIMGEKL